ncbi:MAG TPA: ComEC/Rec2 family competence protein [bacterium]|nr:ComEC/Rec2 family competence protein [bacterium]
MPLCASATVAGSLSSQLIPQNSFWIAASLAACAALLASLFFLARRSAAGRAATGAAVFFVAGFALALAFSSRTTQISVPLDRSARILCEGRVISSPRRLEWGAQADVRLLSCAGRGGAMLPARGAARVSFGGEGAPTDLKPGDVIRFRASFGPAREMKNPGSFSYRSYLAARGIAAVGSAYGKVERVAEAGSAAAGFEKLRRGIADSIAGELAPPARDVVTALAVGERGGIAPEVRESFAESGLAHLMAISGLHVGFVAAAIFVLFRMVFRFFPGVLLFVPIRRLSAFATVPAVWCYVMLTGSPVSAVRAGIMITVFMAGVMWGLRQDVLSTLAVAVVVILVSSPLSTLDVSFQLSVAAVAGIALAAPGLSRLAGERRPGASATARVAAGLLTLLAVSAAATLFTAPLVAWHFKFVAGLSLLANVVAVPAFGALLAPLIALASGLAAFSPESAALLWKLSGVSAALFIRFGVPAMADFAARTLPTSVDQALGAQSLQILDKAFLNPSELPAARQLELQAKFRAMSTEIDRDHAYRLELRASPALGPNALALPSGIVVMTDELVLLAKHDDELVAVLAHEIGHVRGRHALRQLLQTAGVSAITFAILGDVSSISALVSAAPALIEAKHSRDFEREADDFAKQWLARNNIPAHRFDDILCRMEEELGTGDEAGVGKYLSSHPSTDERARCQPP